MAEITTGRAGEDPSQELPHKPADQSGHIRAGVGAVVFKGPEILLIRRGKPPFKGHWSIPGGGIHYGERLEDAVHREVREETGVTIEILGFLKVYEFLPQTYPICEPPTGGASQENSYAMHYLMIDFMAEWISGIPVAGDDAADALFVPVDAAIERIGWDTTRTAVTMAVEMRARGHFIR